MRMPYRTIDSVLNSSWAATLPPAETTDRVLRSTKLEDRIYRDLRSGDGGLDQIEQEAEKKLRSFSSLSRDIFQTFYSLMPRQNEPETLSAAARKFNVPILDHVTRSEDYPTLKSVCEGRELPAYEAAAEFISKTAEELESLLSNIGGDQGGLNTLGKLEAAEKQAREKLSNLLDMLRRTPAPSEELEQAVIKAANQAESKCRQVEAVGKLIDANISGNQDAISALVAQTVQSAAGKAEEVQAIIGAWSDEPGNLERNEVNEDLLARVRKSDVLKDIAKYLGRFREVFAQTMPLFLQKYQRKQIKQYQRREPIYKGMGDIICCLDESISTQGDPAAWGKAVALTLLEIAAGGGRNFALIHFSDPGDFKTDLFRPGAYTIEDKIAAAEMFLNGGTDFETPMREALRLMKEDSFENADIVFVSDGECEMPEPFLEELRQEQAERRFTITGVLLDSGSPGMDFSLKEFCQNIYRTSQLAGEDIVREVVGKRV